MAVVLTLHLTIVIAGMLLELLWRQNAKMNGWEALPSVCSPYHRFLTVAGTVLAVNVALTVCLKWWFAPELDLNQGLIALSSFLGGFFLARLHHG